MPSLSRMTSNVAAQVVSMGGAVVDRVFLVGVLLRLWGTDLFAGYSVVQAGAALALVAELGSQLYFQNMEQAAFVAGDRIAFRRHVGVHLSVLLSIVALLLVALPVLIWSGTVDALFDTATMDRGRGRAVFAVLFAGNALTVLRSLATPIYTAGGDFALIVVFGAAAQLAATLASIAAAVLGGGPLALASVYLAVNGVGALIWIWRDAARRYEGWLSGPVKPSFDELRDAFKHVKWFSLQVVAPAVWLQAPVLVMNGWRVSARDIASFLLIRTMVNLVRQFFQFASIGAGIEIANDVHAGRRDVAWRHSAAIGVVTTVLSASAFAGVLVFGAPITAIWTGDRSLFAAGMAFWLLAPLLLVAPLQQPLSLLQYANRSLAPGLQRLFQIAVGPALCVAGQMLGGPLGLAVGLALAETATSWALLPLMSREPLLPGLGHYCARALAIGAAAFCLFALAAYGFAAVASSDAAPILAVKIALWACVAVLPAAALSLPAGARARIVALVRQRVSAVR